MARRTNEWGNYTCCVYERRNKRGGISLYVTATKYRVDIGAAKRDGACIHHVREYCSAHAKDDAKQQHKWRCMENREDVEK